MNKFEKLYKDSIETIRILNIELKAEKKKTKLLQGLIQQAIKEADIETED